MFYFFFFGLSKTDGSISTQIVLGRNESYPVLVGGGMRSQTLTTAKDTPFINEIKIVDNYTI